MNWWVFYVPGDDEYWGDPSYIEEVKRMESEPGQWWTCHENTVAGDRALLYAKAPISAIVAVLEAVEDAEYTEHEYGSHPWTCTPKCLTIFDTPLPLAEMREDRELRKKWDLIDQDFRSLFGAPRSVGLDVIRFLARKRLPELMPFV